MPHPLLAEGLLGSIKVPPVRLQLGLTHQTNYEQVNVHARCVPSPPSTLPLELTSPPPHPHTVLLGEIVLQKLDDVELVVVVAQVGLRWGRGGGELARPPTQAML